MRSLRLSPVLALLLVAHCSAPTAPIDGGACPATVHSGDSCTTDNTVCQMASSCTQCGRDLFTMFAASCTCSGGHWFCGVVDCFAAAPGVFADPACRVPAANDAGIDVADASIDATTDATDTIDAAEVVTTDSCASVLDVPVAETDVCPTGTLLCFGACVNLLNDPRNCGACGATCGSGQFCLNGTCGCECAAGFTVCGHGCNACSCVDLHADDANCGACDHACGTTERCVSGSCVAADAGAD